MERIPQGGTNLRVYIVRRLLVCTAFKTITKPLLYRTFWRCTVKRNYSFEPVPRRPRFPAVYFSPASLAPSPPAHFAFCNLHSAPTKPLLYRGFSFCTAKPMSTARTPQLKSTAILIVRRTAGSRVSVHLVRPLCMSHISWVVRH